MGKTCWMLMAIILAVVVLGGFVGCKSEKGATGSPGLDGAVGEIGQKGETGPIGSTGPQGIKGESGDRFTFPDGFDGMMPITRGTLYKVPYKVPDGKTLYIMNLNGEGSVPNNLEIDDIKVAPVSGFALYRQPIIVGGGKVISAELPEYSSDIIFSGFLIDTGVEPITRSKLAIEPYAVPDGKTLYIFSLYPDYISYVEVTVGDVAVASITNFTSCQYPIIVEEGRVISTDPHNVTLNSYLKDNE